MKALLNMEHCTVIFANEVNRFLMRHEGLEVYFFARELNQYLVRVVKIKFFAQQEVGLKIACYCYL